MIATILTIYIIGTVLLFFGIWFVLSGFTLPNFDEWFFFNAAISFIISVMWPFALPIMIYQTIEEWWNGRSRKN